MTKIFRVRRRGFSIAADKRNRLGPVVGRTNGDEIGRWRKPFLFMLSRYAERHVAAMARAEDLLLIRTERLRFPLLIERTNRESD